MDKVYLKPTTLEERLLQGQVHEILTKALELALNNAETEARKGWSAWSNRYFAEAYRIVQMIVQVDPLSAFVLKIRLNKICVQMGKTLNGLAVNFEPFTGSRIKIWW